MTNEEFNKWKPADDVIKPYAEAEWTRRGSPPDSTEEQRFSDWMFGKVGAWMAIVFIPLLNARSGQQDRRVK